MLTHNIRVSVLVEISRQNTESNERENAMNRFNKYLTFEIKDGKPVFNLAQLISDEKFRTERGFCEQAYKRLA